METEAMVSSDTDLIKEVMESIGWTDSFLPIVDEENKKLLRLIKFLSKSKLGLISAFEADKRELSRVEELLKNVNNEFNQNLKLLNAHKSQFSAEHHLLKLDEHENSKFKQMLKDVQTTSKNMIEIEENFKRKEKMH